jgi:FKBP-type peptidyl-prolyl cis-trans isomerase FkpA
MSTTAVPIPPTPTGSKIALWGGVAALVLIGGALAWKGTAGTENAACGPNAFLPAGEGVSDPVATPSGLRIQTVKAGQGDKPSDDDVVLVGYRGTLTDGSEFDANPQAPMPVKGVVPGFSEALKLMQRGGSYRLCIPSALGYGDKSPSPKIPANSTLLFEMELFEFKSMAEIQAMQAQMQAEQAKRGGRMPQGMPQGMPQEMPGGGQMPGGPDIQ